MYYYYLTNLRGSILFEGRVWDTEEELHQFMQNLPVPLKGGPYRKARGKHSERNRTKVKGHR